MSDSLQHDDLLFNMLKECKTLPVFLDHIFGFLNRRTDFYFETTAPNSPVGLPKGLAERLVRNAYFKWKPVSKKEQTSEQTVLLEDEVPQVIAEEVVVASEEVDEQELVDNLGSFHIDEDPDSREEPYLIPLFSPPEYYNGSIIDNNYCWSQSIVDLDVIIQIPENVSAKNLQVTVLAQRLTVKLKGNELLDGELCQKCKYNDVVWSVDGRKLLIHLDKCKEMWWDCLLTSEERLDLSKIDCSRPFEDLPEEAQLKIEELAWNQERKIFGSNEISKAELLRKAWNAEGSPFSGPFDSSQVVFQ